MTDSLHGVVSLLLRYLEILKIDSAIGIVLKNILIVQDLNDRKERTDCVRRDPPGAAGGVTMQVRLRVLPARTYSGPSRLARDDSGERRRGMRHKGGRGGVKN